MPATTERLARPIAVSRRQLIILVASLIVATLVIAAVVTRPRPDPAHQTATVTGELPPAVGSWSGGQLANAAIIMQAGEDLGLSERDRTIAVMTAMGESSLTVVDHGDTAGPDSRGLFQQRDGWGSYEVRMDAYGSSVLFYRVLETVDGRDDTAPTLVAHAVQINQDPQHYAAYWEDAVEVVAAIQEADPFVLVESVEG